MTQIYSEGFSVGARAVYFYTTSIHCSDSLAPVTWDQPGPWHSGHWHLAGRTLWPAMGPTLDFNASACRPMSRIATSLWPARPLADWHIKGCWHGLLEVGLGRHCMLLFSPLAIMNTL